MEETRKNQVDALAEAAKTDPEIMPALWEAVERFIKLQAKKRYTLIGGNFGGCEVEDLVQSGYIALVDAVEDYEPGRGSFITILGLHLKTAFAEAAGIRSAKRDALLYAESLDVALNKNDEEPDAERIVFLPDPAAEAAFQDAEDRVFTEELNKALRRAIDALSPRKREIIKQKYLDGLRTEQIAKEQGVTQAAIYNVERAALRQMRQQAYKTGLIQFVELHTIYYRHYGVETMRRTQTSPVEAVFFEREDIRKTWENRQWYTVIN